MPIAWSDSSGEYNKMGDLQRVLDVANSFVSTIVPILVPVIFYLSNKKSQKDIMNELRAKLLEKDRETSNEIRKMAVILDNYKQQTCWSNSTEITSEYLKNIVGTKRCTSVLYLATLTSNIKRYLTEGSYNLSSLKKLKQMLNKMQIPLDEHELYPIEIVNLFDYEQLVEVLDKKIKELEENTDR